MTALPDGLIVVAKRDCPTCELVAPVLGELAKAGPLTVYSQDDPSFPATVPAVEDDTGLETSFRLGIEIVPTLIKVQNGQEVARTYGWSRAEWRKITGLTALGAELPELRPGCGSKSVEPGVAEVLEARHGNVRFDARKIELSDYDDDYEACFERGWSDGLPVIPPTPERVLRMLAGTTRAASEVLGDMPPEYAPLTVEKVAINAVMAGAKPEYMPVILAAVEAVFDEAFCLHGTIATTQFVGPVVVVSGPIAKTIGMNWGVNALGQGNRANAAIGRTVQLIIRNHGGGRPGEVDRATLGNPGKLTFCFAEDEEDNSWDSWAVERGIAKGKSAVTVFAGDGIQGIADQLSREPDSLARTFAASLRQVQHPKAMRGADAILVVSPEHERVFRLAGWSKARLKQELDALLTFPTEEVVRGADGIAAGIKPPDKPTTHKKFRDGGLHIVRAGGKAGLFSAIISGWAASGGTGSSPVTKEVRS
jgi:hypothetical protein